MDFICLLQSLPGVLPKCLQQPVASAVRSTLYQHERFVDQASKDIQRARHAHGTRGREIEAAGEYGEPAEQLLLSGGQKVVAPIDGCSERLMANGGAAAGAPQERETILEMRKHL